VADTSWEEKYAKYRQYNYLREAKKGDLVVLYMPGDVAVAKVVVSARKVARRKRDEVRWAPARLTYYGDPDLPRNAFQRVNGRFVPLWAPCDEDPPCPPRKAGRTAAEHTAAKVEEGGEGRRKCECGRAWQGDFDADVAVIANFKSTRDGKLPRQVVEVLRRDPRFGPTWDFDRDVFCGPLEAGSSEGSLSDVKGGRAVETFEFRPRPVLDEALQAALDEEVVDSSCLGDEEFRRAPGECGMGSSSSTGSAVIATSASGSADIVADAEDLHQNPRYEDIRKLNTVGEATRGDMVVLVNQNELLVGKVHKKDKRNGGCVLIKWYGDQKRVDAELPQQVSGKFSPVKPRCSFDPKCPAKRKGARGHYEHGKAKKRMGPPERMDCPCGDPWMDALEVDGGVLASKFNLVRGKLPKKVVEVLHRDPRFVWDWEKDAPVVK
jgi:hypothetical protein